MAGPEDRRATQDTRLRVLVVDDDLVVARLIRQILARQGFRDLRVVGTGAEGLAAADTADLILLDHQLPDANGVELIPRFLALPDPPSLIIITGHGSEALAATALRLGAEDYLRKDSSLQELLPQVIERVRRARALRGALATAEAELVRRERLAAIGEMTVTLHHELNNPLMAGLAEVDLLLGDLKPDHEVREPLLAIRQALLRMRTILQQARSLGRADRAEYVRGVGMIDLDQQARSEVAAVMGRAALWIPENRLARVTGLVLGNAGFQVSECASRESVDAELRRGASIVVLGPTGPRDNDPLRGFGPDPNRTWTLVVLTPGDPAQVQAAGADLAIHLPFDPDALGAEILAALRS